MAITTKLPRGVGEYASLPQSNYVEGASLAAATAERFAIPADANGVRARFVLFSCTDNFCAKMGGSSVTAAMPTDTTDGTASMLNPTFREIALDATHISVISTNASLLTMEFFLKI